jgi:hypothetical protein
MSAHKRFKRWSLTLVLALLAGRLTAGPSRTSSFGAGLALDTSLWPLFTGAGASLTGKLWFDGVNAIDMSLGGGHGGVGLGATYLWHSAKAFKRRDIPLYYGLGGYLGLGNHHTSAGAQAKIGVTWLFPGTPWDVYVEGVPRLNLLGGIGFGAGLSGGFRFYF